MSRSPHSRHARASTTGSDDSKPVDLTCNTTTKDSGAAYIGKRTSANKGNTSAQKLSTGRQLTGNAFSGGKKVQEKSSGSRVRSPVGKTNTASDDDVGSADNDHDSRDSKSENSAGSDEVNKQKLSDNSGRTKTKSIAEKARRLSRAKHSCKTSRINAEHTESDKHDVSGEDSVDSSGESLKRESTYVKPEPSILTAENPMKDEKVFGDRETSSKEKSVRDVTDKSSTDKRTVSPYRVLEYVYSGEKTKTMDTKSSDDNRQTIEDVASNFMKRVERLEQENTSLLADNRRLLDKLKSAEEAEEKLINEVHVLKGEYADLTIDYHNVKDENLALVRRLAEANKERDSLKKALQEEVASLTEEIKSLEEEKVRLRNALDDMELTVEELRVKSNTDEAALKSLQEEVESLREENKTLVSSNKLEQLQDESKEKEGIIRDLEKKLAVLDQIQNEKSKMEKELKSLRKQVKEKDVKLAEKDDYISSLDKEKELLCDELSKLRATVKEKTTEVEEIRKKKESLSNSKKALQKTIGELTSENEALRAQRDTTSRQDDEIETLKAEIKELKSKIDIMKTTERAMSDLLLSKQNHIADLRNENAELRNVNKLQKQEMDELRAERKEKEVISDKYGDIADSHKRLLAENRRLRSMMANKAMQETNAATERSELESEMEKLERKLSKAQKRIVQLENWMDDIYSGKEYAMVPRTDDFRSSVLSLPEISLLDTSRSKKLTGRRTSRKDAAIERITARSLAEMPR